MWLLVMKAENIILATDDGGSFEVACWSRRVENKQQWQPGAVSCTDNVYWQWPGGEVQMKRRQGVG